MSGKSLAVLSLVIACSCLQHVDAAGLKPVDLRCEYLQDPIGIDQAKPRLNWRVESDQRGQRQTAYRVLVASSMDQLAQEQGDLWDTGKVPSSRTIQIEYAGKPLNARQGCFWKVRVWDRDGTESAWSEPASWSMGLLDDSDWSADYISYRDETPVFTDRKSPVPATGAAVSQGVFARTSRSAARRSTPRRWASTNCT